MAALAQDSLIFSDQVASSTGLNACMATLLTGLSTREHGVGSLHELGRARLRDSVRTLAEAFQEQGWATLLACAAPQLHPELSGFDQGFETIQVASLAEPTRSAQQVIGNLIPTLGRLLQGEQRVFAVVQLSDLDPRGNRAAPEPHGARWLGPRLGAFAKAQPPIADALAKAQRNPEAALEDLDGLLRRRRSADVARAWKRALRDGRASALDAQIGALLDLVNEGGRGSSALVAVQGLRGAVLEPPASLTGPGFLPKIMHTPLVLRIGGQGPVLKHRGLTSAGDLPRALDVLFTLGLDPSAFPGADLLAIGRGADTSVEAIFASAAGLARHALFTDEVQLERAATQADVLFTRAGQLLPPGSEPRALSDATLARFEAFCQPRVPTLASGGARRASG